MATTEAPGQRGGDAGARVAERLREEILRGALSPGDRILQEELAERFGASRVPIREAIRILVHEGLVTTVANSGSWVARLTLAECEEVYLMRERLEPLLLRYSAPHLTDADFAELQSLAARVADASTAGDVDGFLRFDRQFHLASYAHAETQQLGDLISKLWNSTAPYRRAYVATWSSDLQRLANDEHHLLIETLRDRDIDEAERVLAGHIRRTRRQLARHPEIFGGES
ncbi:GntR family transcriptional regulator [Leucobacter rhizosphaerae]|uniref:GntR family transcriptional regulator n=1 Tax=Leucobacter rhizosphaerae TaxID=2932245 RepID=A0ABY4FSJ5_9MICO|nr:GntR family transcriptional regulator [Leucobacter rhizosphaerae]UOQ59212.1 GntR family transcriptional regulator [Leucobacter rhizosphaerae]